MKSRKVTGIIIASVLVLIALIVFGVSQIKITPKQPVTTSQAAPTETLEAITSDEKVLVKIINESLLDYTGADIVVEGTVSAKECYLNGSQVMYLLKLRTATGTEMDYLCSYSVYNSVGIEEVLMVTYKNLTESAYAIMSVSK